MDMGSQYLRVRFSLRTLVLCDMDIMPVTVIVAIRCLPSSAFTSSSQAKGTKSTSLLRTRKERSGLSTLGLRELAKQQ